MLQCDWMPIDKGFRFVAWSGVKRIAESLKRPLRAQIAWVLVACGALSLVVSLRLGPDYNIEVTGFGRDLLGATLARSGENPYRKVVGLPPSAIDGAVEGVAESATWIAHSPFALGLARLWLEVLPVQSLEPAALGVLVAALLVAGVITFQLTRSLEPEVSLEILGGSAFLMGARSDFSGFRGQRWWPSASMQPIGWTEQTGEGLPYFSWLLWLRGGRGWLLWHSSSPAVFPLGRMQ